MRKGSNFIVIFLLFWLTGNLFPQQMKSIPIPKDQITGSIKSLNTFSNPPKLQAKFKNESSRGKALLLSLILPGAGEYYLGHKKTAIGFMIAEIGFWAGYFWTGHRYTTMVKDSRNWAYLFAQVNPDGEYPEEFWRAVGSYDNVYENNQRQLIDRNLNGVFDENQFFWDWLDDEQRFQYNRLRIKAKDFKNLRNSIAFTFFVNRVLSLIDVIRISNQEKKKNLSWNIRYIDTGFVRGFGIHVTKVF